MIDCGKISANLTLASCNVSTVAVEPEVILLNHADIDEVTEADGVISAIVLKEGANGYKYSTFRNGVEGTVGVNVSTYVTRFTHQLLIRVFSKTQEIKDQLNALANGRVVAIVKNASNESEEVKYEVYGKDNGLIVTDLQAVTTDADGIVYAVTLASGENAYESQLPASFYATSLEQTETTIEALLGAN